MHGSNVIFWNSTCGSNSSNCKLSEKSTESSASSSTEAVRAQKVLQALLTDTLQVRNQKLLQMTRLAVLQVQGLHQNNIRK